MNNIDFDVDLVYLWVDGSDPEWLARKNAFIGIADADGYANCKGRYTNNDELKFSLRSVEKHASWLRKIFIVTDGQTPEWLNTSHPKIQLIDHRQIMPKEALPCYNSMVLECFLYKIPDLSEHFLYANDDMLFNADLTPDFFYAKDGWPIVRLKRKPFGKWRYRWKHFKGKEIDGYRKIIYAMASLVEQKFGKFYSGIPHHNIDAYLKTDYQEAVEHVFKENVEASLHHHVRQDDDFERAAFLYYALAIKHAHLKHVERSESYLIGAHRTNYEEIFGQCSPKLFCINDSEFVSDADRLRAKLFLWALFPDKSAFEK
ncbi:MAG: Stealth CR1 domain-containing protein [Prevotella sp.]|jgi:hypothetical protein|nr:Stealth CR1 domain-containing protein [Prevotella sp.]